MTASLIQTKSTDRKYQLLALLILFTCTLFPLSLQAEENENLNQKLAKLPHPWQEKPHRLTLKEYTETLKYWEEALVEQGIAFQLRIPYQNPDLSDIRLNGHLLQKSETDDYISWNGDGFTHVQVNVPPEKAKNNDLYIITCLYHPHEKRAYGWKPPQTVLERIKQKKSTY